MGREIVSFTDRVRILDYCVTSLASESICSFGSCSIVHLHRPNPRACILPIQSFLMTFNSTQQSDLSFPLLSFLFMDYREQGTHCGP
jgi:hypothetical protein